MKISRKIVLLSLLLGAYAWAQVPLLPVGSEARKFLLLDLDNQRLGYKDWIGEKAPLAKPLVLISFWSLSCVPCNEEMPELQKFADQNSDKVALIFVNLDSKSLASAVQDRVEQTQIHAKVLLDSYQVTGKNYNVCSSQGACNVPALYGISQQGNVVLAQAGYEGPAKLQELLNKALQNLSKKQQAPVIDKKALLQEVHQKAPLDAIAKGHGLTRAQLVQILKEAETAASKSWD